MTKVKSIDKRVKEIKNYINHNYGDSSLTMETISQHIGINPRYMLKIFKAGTGYLLKDYILELRMNRAKELLNTKLTIEAISKKCGYTTSHSFIRAFKRACGMTPGEMRQSENPDEI